MLWITGHHRGKKCRIGHFDGFNVQKRWGQAGCGSLSHDLDTVFVHVGFKIFGVLGVYKVYTIKSEREDLCVLVVGEEAVSYTTWKLNQRSHSHTLSTRLTRNPPHIPIINYISWWVWAGFQIASAPTSVTCEKDNHKKIWKDVSNQHYFFYIIILFFSISSLSKSKTSLHHY